MLNSKYVIFIVYIGLLIGGFSSCYQKRVPKNELKVSSYQDTRGVDSTIQGLDTEIIPSVDTFKLVPTKEIHTAIQKNTKRKKAYHFPTISKKDSLEKHEQIEQIALSNVYLTLGKLSNNKKLYQTAFEENIRIMHLYNDSIVIDKKIGEDSLEILTKLILTEKNQAEFAYYEAVIWLENLYLTIENATNSISSKKLEELVFLQLDNGSEMLTRLSYYQDYEPISVFSQQLINLLDCRYTAFNAIQFKSDVEEVRQLIYLP